MERRFDPIRKRLVDLSLRPEVWFLFSGAHLSEMAPTGAMYANAASRRADVLVELCGRKALIPYHSILDLEAEILHEDRAALTTGDIVRHDGSWFPAVDQFFTPRKWADELKNALDREVQERGLNRKMRRMMKGKLMKGEAPRMSSLANLDPISTVEICKKYPMRDKDARIISLYSVGRASAKQADQAFLESLRDPSWMMRWFHDNFDDLGGLGNLVRGPARSTHLKAEVVIAKFAEAEQLAKSTGVDLLSGSHWKVAKETLTADFANTLIQGAYPGAVKIESTPQVFDVARGVSTFVCSLLSSMRNSVGKTKRSFEPNDVVDATHAIYAPYVDFFRADRYMAPIVQEHVRRYGTVVVNKLEDLPDLIEAAL